MKIIRSVRKMQRFSRALRANSVRIGLVPTMGYLHEGHARLLRAARRHARCVVMSIFVNPAQFGPKEDYARYPRDFARDMRLAKKEKVDVVFYPAAGDMYPRGYRSFVTVGDLSERLCGRSRPGHFRGVATVVCKLFNIVMPETAYFGQKDAQQVRVIRQMAHDLNIPVRIKEIPTAREPDGLAISSRNVYLSAQERAQAPSLVHALRHAQDLVRGKERNAAVIMRQMRAILAKAPRAKIDYIAVVDYENLRPLSRVQGKTLIALAVWFGKTRLIDNVIVRA
jgi:pantoate--beta-alanine ligase